MAVAERLVVPESPTGMIARYPCEDRLGLAHLAVAFGALFVGAIFGLLQALVRAGALPVPISPSYYQYLTAHGILMALIFTTFFILGFLINGVARALGMPFTPLARNLCWAGFWVMLLSTIGAVIEVLSNRATVLYTFYAPLQASATFYIGLTLFIVGTWITSAGIFVAYIQWRQAHQGQLSPLFAFTAVATLVLWLEATVGVAIEAIFQLIPWALGWEPRINVELSRTLFWYFGHPLVYFWLMPAYIAWYLIIPRIAGSKVVSDSLVRLSFILLVVFSVPVGIHHELMDTGISAQWKFVQVILTYFVIVPSLMTAFAVVASLERAGRARGGRGLLGWIVALPWKDPRFLAPALGMISFVFGGAGGMVNASYEMDGTVHNTLWIVGHFHITLATSVALTFFGITYWLLPLMTGRPLWGTKLAVAQALIWVVGMTLMSGAMHIVGLLGDPRRTASTDYGASAISAAWQPYMTVVAIGGSLLGVGVVLFEVVVIGTVLSARRQEAGAPFAEVQPSSLPTPPILERWRVWVGLTAVLVVLAYAIPIVQLIVNAPPGSPGYDTWGGASASGAPATSASPVVATNGAVSFSANVAPILRASCAACHIATQSGGLNLGSYAALMKGGATSSGGVVDGPVVVPGDHTRSYLWTVLEGTNLQGGQRMPLGGPYVSDAEAQTIARWIDQGAKNR